MAWKKGQSGNPAGRPPKSRELSEILAKTGDKAVEYNGKNIAGKRLVALLLWEIATTGKTTLPSGLQWIAGPESWLDVVKFIYNQVDGPPKQSLELGGIEGAPITILEVVKDNGSPSSDSE